MFKLRYYAPHYRNEVHNKIVELLSTIKQMHEIDFDVVQLRMKTAEYGSYVDEEHEREIYESEFLPRVHTLCPRVGVSLRRALRSRNGHFTISGVVLSFKTICLSGLLVMKVVQRDFQRVVNRMIIL